MLLSCVQEVYDSHCVGLEGPLHDHIATTNGVVSNSVLNTCRYFHVSSGLVPDIMHDILEGSLKLCMRHPLIYLIQEKLNALSDRISFDYGPSEVKNRPTEISAVSLSSDGRLKQSSMFIHLLQ